MRDDLFKTFEEAQHAAQMLSMKTGYHHVVNYRPGGVMPYNTLRLPQIGDEVSMTFNGDYYPLGKITAISKAGTKITTERGDVFTQPRKTISDREGREFPRYTWKRGGGPFCLIAGHHDERNPHI